MKIRERFMRYKKKCKLKNKKPKKFSAWLKKRKKKEQEKKIKKTNIKRTVLDFVYDMLERKRSKKQILCVARNTRWQNQIKEVKKIIKKEKLKTKQKKLT